MRPFSWPEGDRRSPEVGVSLTVVVAVVEEPAALAEALESLDYLGEQARGEIQVLVVSDFPRPASLRFGAKAAWLELPEGSLVPHAWARGIEEAEGDWVLLTTAHFVLDGGWWSHWKGSRIDSDVSGVGGAIGPPRGLGVAAWATYFLRYSAYSSLGPGTVQDVAGDHAVYRRSDLEAFESSMVGGFWEPDFHRWVHRRGRRLVYDPSLRTRQRASFGWLRFCRQRRQHGRQFGQARLEGKGLLSRILGVLAFPLIPPILLVKVVRRVVRSGQNIGAFVFSLPALALFVLAWALGEVEGYWSAR